MPPSRSHSVWLAPLFLLSCSSTWLSLVCVGQQTSYHQNPLGGNNGTSSPLCWGHWQSIGPFHVAQTYPGINDLTDPEDIGSVSDIWLTGPTAYLGSVNGGVWRTRNISGVEAYGGPHWEALTDHMPCTSISAISGSKDDTNIIVAGCGFPSNADGRGSEPLGVMISKDGGATWNMTAFPRGYWVSDIIVDGTDSTSVRLLVSAKEGILVKDRFGTMTDPYGIGNSTGGIWRSIDGGATFVQVYSGSVNRIVQDPSSGSTDLYGSLLYYPPNTVLIKSTNAGLTWSSWLTPNFTRQCPGYDQIENSQLTVVGSYAYAGFYLTQSNAAAGSVSSCFALFKSFNREAFTDVTGVPSQDSLGNLGSSSGSTHLTILAAPTLPDILFVAGSGHAVYRVDTINYVWTLISSVPGLNPTTPATRSGTAPHADANRFEWNSVTGDLLLTNGGSVYHRTNPLLASNLGDWFSLSGDLAITEVHDFSLDSYSGTILLASQDNSFMMSQFDGTEANSGMWSFLSRGPADWTGMDEDVAPTAFYGANHNLRNFFQVDVLSSQPITSWSLPINQNCSVGAGTCPHSTLAIDQHYPWVSFICTGGSSTTNTIPSSSTICYELDWPFRHERATVTPLEFDSNAFDLNGASTAIDVLVAGTALRNGQDNYDVVFAAGVGYTWSRDVPCANTNTTCISVLDQCSGDSCNVNNFVNRRPPWVNTGKPLRFVEQNNRDYYQNIIVDGIGHIYLTIDFGVSYIDLNLPEHSNLLALSGHTSVDTFSTGAVMFFQRQGEFSLILVGTGHGIFVTFADPSTAQSAANFTFYRLGANLPRTVVTSFAYRDETDTLYVSTSGRGLWTLHDVSGALLALENNHPTDLLNLVCLRPLYPNVPNAYGYIPPPGLLPADIGFPLKQVIVSGVHDISLTGSLTLTITVTHGLPPGPFTLQPIITTSGDHGFFTPSTITLSGDSFYDESQTVTWNSTGNYLGQLNFTTKLLGDFIYLGFEPYTTSFNICNGTCSVPSSSSSTGVGSSSSTGPSVASSSSTGSSAPINVTIPDLLPSFTISLLASTPNHTSPQFRGLLSTDLAEACSVDSSRIMILEKIERSASIDFTFTITPLLLPSPTLNDSNVSFAGQQFLAVTALSTSTFFTLPIGRYCIPRSGSLTPSPSDAISQLQQISFGLDYDINNIPDGNTIKSFSALILADVATAISIPASRLFMLSITAGSIQASFTVSPNITVNETSDAQIIQSFLSVAADTDSLLYSGATTSATIEGSATVGVPGSSTPLPDDSSSNDHRVLLIGIICGVGGGLLLCCCLLICYYGRSEGRPQKKKAPPAKAPSRRPSLAPPDVFTHAAVLGGGPNGPTPAGSFELSEINVHNSNLRFGRIKVVKTYS